jgi:8-amino-3,8-dideoxy-alpha-D-manno-octulosonate transaminase
MDRRTFLTGAAAAAGVFTDSPALAGTRDKPVRDTPLRAGFFGTQYYDDKERRQLTDVLDARQPYRWYGPGTRPPQKAAALEKELADRMQTRFALAVTSGTAALSTAIAALEVGPGDEVILPAWTWHSCYSAVVLAGALPIFAEIDESLTLDPGDVEKKITPQTKVIMAVHTLGNPCDMDRILAIARKHRIPVLEDCAQSVGAGYKGRPVGSLGDIGIYSMQINKTITSGEGGALVTNDPLLFERAARSHDLGLLRSLHEQRVGKARLDTFAALQFRMSEFTAAVLLAQLGKLDRIVAALRGNAARVYAGLRDLSGLQWRRRADPDGELGIGVFLSFRTKQERDSFTAGMKAENVPAQPPSGSVLLPMQPYIEQKRTVHPAWPSFQSARGKSIRYGAECCPRSLDILNRCAGVPLDPKYTEQDTADIVAAIRKVHRRVTGKD